LRDWKSEGIYVQERNIIIISLDEVRPDNLSCYGYKKTNTPHIDYVSSHGVKFETCITSSMFTPVAMSSVITGKNPNKNGIRDPYCYLLGPSIAVILKKYGYTTAGFVGNGLLSKIHGFAEGFDYWNEPTKDTHWEMHAYPGSARGTAYGTTDAYAGNYWVEDFFNWLKKNHQKKFFMWGHLYETHEGSQFTLLKKGLIKEGELSEFSYKDAKIKMVDEKLVGRLLETLNIFGISENTTLVVMSDHGTNLGEHPVDRIPWREEVMMYPQHATMYDEDIKVAMVIKGQSLPQGKTVKGMVRTVDLIPTLLDLMRISVQEYDFDGVSLLPVIDKGEAHGMEAYAEDFFELRGKGALQSIRTDDLKYIRNITLWTEEYYDLHKDPKERNNLINKIDKATIIGLRKKLNAFLKTQVPIEKEIVQEKEKINERLRRLGYIE